MRVCVQEPMDVVELFGLKGVQHTPISIKNARVSQVRCLSANSLVTLSSLHHRPAETVSVIQSLVNWKSLVLSNTNKWDNQRQCCVVMHTVFWHPSPTHYHLYTSVCSLLSALQSQSHCNLQPTPSEYFHLSVHQIQISNYGVVDFCQCGWFVFDLQDANFAIVLEEDLDISIDFFR